MPTFDAKLEGLLDPEVLAIAAREKRVLVTHDRKTMPIEFGRFIAEQLSAGVLIISQCLCRYSTIDLPIDRIYPAHPPSYDHPTPIPQKGNTR